MISLNGIEISSEQQEILTTLFEFGEEHWAALSGRYEERTGETLPDGVYDMLKDELTQADHSDA